MAIRQEVLESGYFDADWYLAQHPALKTDREATRDPVGHFMVHGVERRLNPGPGFDTRWYLDEYEDVRSVGINPLLHYLRHGRYENRRPLPLPTGRASSCSGLRAQWRPRAVQSKLAGGLDHETRVRQLHSLNSLEAWRSFSQRFRELDPGLSLSQRTMLHNAGFLPDKLTLYGFPRSQMASYLSDVQVSLLPTVNGDAGLILEDFALQYQLLSQRLPMISGVKANPDGLGQRMRVLLVLAPATGRLTPLAAVVLMRDHNRTTRSLNLSTCSGRVRSVASYRSGALLSGPRKASLLERYRYRSAWQQVLDSVLVPLASFSRLTFASVDIALSRSGPQVLGLGHMRSPEAFQVHGPLMTSETAVDFMREFGL